MKKQLHNNTYASYIELLKTLPDRQKKILWAIKKMTDLKRPITDRAIKTYLMLDDMNQVRPRVTELLKQGHIKETDPVQCIHTGRQVRSVDLAC